ncbi:hypothetical protein RBS60_01800 [Sinomonas sp. ASV486]|uniref:hypothetical protein n=1 Tax=Sinomonas sp. ASV486 TaxID=3051170 RepID=UPI0027DD85BF|nr:hypothetical protein [Sinomonas sp. ASV486]MDQ4488927.1 hypothetical protein [Sinomonas sp. ASV486]
MNTDPAPVEFDLHTTAAPESVRSALLDFSPRRPELWPAIEPSLYEVYSVGATSAEIREGSKGPGGRVWAREEYDFSDPHTVRWTVRESNFSEPGSYVSATISPEGAGSIVHIAWNRVGSGFMGRLICAMVRRSGGRPVAQSFGRGLSVLEASADGRTTASARRRAR